MRIRPLLLIMVFFAAVAVAPSVSWFREKYLTHTYNEYYTYTLTRWRMEDNDRDVCPDTHTSAIYFAITGQQLWQRQPRIRRARLLPQRHPSHLPRIPIYTAHDARLIHYTVGDAAFFLLEFAEYCCELLIILLSVLMALLTSMILMILVFGQ